MPEDVFKAADLILVELPSRSKQKPWPIILIHAHLMMGASTACVMEIQWEGWKHSWLHFWGCYTPKEKFLIHKDESRSVLARVSVISRFRVFTRDCPTPVPHQTKQITPNTSLISWNSCLPPLKPSQLSQVVSESSFQLPWSPAFSSSWEWSVSIIYMKNSTGTQKRLTDASAHPPSTAPQPHTHPFLKRMSCTLRCGVHNECYRLWQRNG